MKRKSYVVAQNQISFFEPETPSMPVLDVSRCEASLISKQLRQALKWPILPYPKGNQNE